MPAPPHPRTTRICAVCPIASVVACWAADRAAPSCGCGGAEVASTCEQSALLRGAVGGAGGPSSEREVAQKQLLLQGWSGVACRISAGKIDLAQCTASVHFYDAFFCGGSFAAPCSPLRASHTAPGATLCSVVNAGCLRPSRERFGAACLELQLPPVSDGAPPPGQVPIPLLACRRQKPWLDAKNANRRLRGGLRMSACMAAAGVQHACPAPGHLSTARDPCDCPQARALVPRLRCGRPGLGLSQPAATPLCSCYPGWATCATLARALQSRGGSSQLELLGDRVSGAQEPEAPTQARCIAAAYAVWPGLASAAAVAPASPAPPSSAALAPAPRLKLPLLCLLLLPSLQALSSPSAPSPSAACCACSAAGLGLACLRNSHHWCARYAVTAPTVTTTPQICSA